MDMVVRMTINSYCDTIRKNLLKNPLITELVEQAITKNVLPMQRHEV